MHARAPASSTAAAASATQHSRVDNSSAVHASHMLLLLSPPIRPGRRPGRLTLTPQSFAEAAEALEGALEEACTAFARALKARRCRFSARACSERAVVSTRMQGRCSSVSNQRACSWAAASRVSNQRACSWAAASRAAQGQSRAIESHQEQLTRLLLGGGIHGGPCVMQPPNAHPILLTLLDGVARGLTQPGGELRACRPDEGRNWWLISARQCSSVLIALISGSCK